MKDKVAFIGLGAMGKPIASNIAKAGYELHVFDLVSSYVDDLVIKGALQAASPYSAANNADIIFLSLPNAVIVEQVITASDGVLAGSHPGQIIIDLSSVPPKHTKKMAELAAAKGVEYLDAPVSGGVSGAIAGSLTIMVGGKPEVFAQCEELLSVIGKRLFHVGDIGAGDALKLVNNLMLGINMIGVAEALTLGIKAGLNPKTILEVISVSSGRSYAFETKVPNFILKDNFEAGFSIDLQYKDLEMATRTAKELGMPLLLANLAEQVYEVARSCGLGRYDISAVAKLLDKMSSTEA